MKTAEDIVNDKQREMVTISYDQTVLQACREMADHKIGVILINLGRETFRIARGDRIAQLVVQRLPDVEMVEVETLPRVMLGHKNTPLNSVGCCGCLGETGLEDLRIVANDAEVEYLDAELFGLFDDQRLQPHFHIPLQSGDDIRNG